MESIRVCDDKKRASRSCDQSETTHSTIKKRYRSRSPLTPNHQEVTRKRSCDPSQDPLSKPSQPDVKQPSSLSSSQHQEKQDVEEQFDFYRALLLQHRLSNLSSSSSTPEVLKLEVFRKRKAEESDSEPETRRKQRKEEQPSSSHITPGFSVIEGESTSFIPASRFSHQNETTSSTTKKRYRSRSPLTPNDQEVKRKRSCDPSQDPLSKPSQPDVKQPSGLSSSQHQDKQDVEEQSDFYRALLLQHRLSNLSSSSLTPEVLKLEVFRKRKAEESDSEPETRKKQRKEEQPSSSHITPGFSVIEGLPYLKGPMLGEGGFGSVFAGIRISDGLQVAIKYIPKRKARVVRDDEYGVMPMEVALMKRVNSAPACPNILELLEWFELPSEYGLILERPEHSEDLHNFSKYSSYVDEDLAKKVMLQLVNALKHCESRGVMHRDVKSKNILIRSDTHEIKLLDFGCGELSKELHCGYAGTLMYAPPEFFVFGLYDATPATVWSLGILLYDILYGNIPFRSTLEIVNKHLHMLGLSKDCEELISWCLRKNPDNRPSFEEIEQHPWFH